MFPDWPANSHFALLTGVVGAHAGTRQVRAALASAGMT